MQKNNNITSLETDGEWEINLCLVAHEYFELTLEICISCIFIPGVINTTLYWKTIISLAFGYTVHYYLDSPIVSNNAFWIFMCFSLLINDYNERQETWAKCENYFIVLLLFCPFLSAASLGQLSKIAWQRAKVSIFSDGWWARAMF